MSFYPLEYLKEGKVDFVFECSHYDYENLIELVRNAPNKIEIINGFLPKLKESLPSFCLNIIYDIPEFSEVAYELLDIKDINPEMLNNLLNNSPLGLRVLTENLDYLLSLNSDKNYNSVIFKYAFESNNKSLLYRLSRHSNLHTRFLFMDYLIRNYPEQVDTIYDDITKYTTSIIYEPYEQLTFLPELMSPEDISKLAVLLLIYNREDDYQKLKEYILKNYKYNYIASQLLKDEWKQDVETHIITVDSANKEKKENAFIKDADSLFNTSADYPFSIYLRHSDKISQEILDEFASRIKYFLDSNKNNEVEAIYQHGLGKLLEEWTEKYMEASKSKEYGYVGGGTTCDCYRIGDYVIKLVKSKWSYEDVICPNLYLIAKNYEEIYLRDKKGFVTGGLEVQKYLSRRADNIDPKYFRYFDLALDRLGYKRTDTLTGGTRGENTMLLDTYRDADCPNPERVPIWFKKTPLVLIDRDRIYPKNKTNIKQLR